MTSQELKYQIIQKGFEQVLNDAKVPQRVHLQALQALAAKIKAHEELMKKYESLVSTSNSHSEAHARQVARYEALLKEFKDEIERRKLEKGDKGDPGKDAISIKGDPGDDAVAPSIEEIVASVLPKIRVPKDGDPGKDAKIDPREVAIEVANLLKDEQMLDLSHIKGAQRFIKDGVSYRVEELMHGGGGSSSTSSGYQVPTSGVVNGTNNVFTWATAPNVIVLDNGNAMNKVSADGSINWSGTTTTTLAQAPNGNIYAVA